MSKQYQANTARTYQPVCETRERKIARAERKLLDAAEKYASRLSEGHPLGPTAAESLFEEGLKSRFLSAAADLARLKNLLDSRRHTRHNPHLVWRLESWMET
jgi:hypothetical protein